MIRVAITTEAFDALDAVSDLLPLGTVNFEREPDANGERFIWLAPDVFNKVRALREPGESYSDLILKLVELKAKSEV